jgi:hypothetical protein
MNTIVLIIALQILVITLTGCSTFEDKLQELQCTPPHDSLCVGVKV